MKKFLFLIGLIGVVSMSVPIKSEAQNIAPTALKSATGYAKDTVTAASTKYMIFQNSTTGYGKITGRNEVTIVANGLEISGTTSGSLRLEASIDSVIWYPYYLGSLPHAVDSVGSNYRLTLADQTGNQPIRWVIPQFSDGYIRVAALGGGTTNWSVAAKLQARKLPD
jgi:hypothetical protein